MIFPIGVRTRVVTCGAPYPTIESNPNLKLQLRVKLSSSRSLIWNGDRIDREFNILQYGSPGVPAKFECVVTDMVGMLDAETQQLIDISGGAHTHVLTARLRVFLGTEIVWEDVKTFVVPSSDNTLIISSDEEPLNLNEFAIPDPVMGILVPYSGPSDTQILSAVDDYMLENLMATVEYVETQISNHESSLTPHQAYDDMHNLTLIFENGLV